MQKSHLVSVTAAGLVAGLLSTACADASRTVSPNTQRDAAPSRVLAGAASTAQATQQYLEIPVSIDGYFTFSCLTEPIRFVVTGTIKLYVTNTPSGMTLTRGLFDIDRSVTYVVYKGVTYTVATGRPGHDDVWHVTQSPSGLYVEVGVEPDFESSATGERLRLNLVWQVVVDANGNVRREFRFLGACPPA